MFQNNSNTLKENDVPQHLFISPNHSLSDPCSSSYSSRTKENGRKKLIDETSFISNDAPKTKVTVVSKLESKNF